MAEPLTVEQSPDEHRRLVESVEPLAESGSEVDPERVVLALEPAPAEPEDRSTCRHVVDRRRQLGDESRVAERRGRHEQAEADTLRAGRHRRERRPALELWVAPVTLVRQQVIVEPQRIPATSLDRSGGVAEAWPVGALDPEGRPEAHRLASAVEGGEETKDRGRGGVGVGEDVGQRR